MKNCHFTHRLWKIEVIIKKIIGSIPNNNIFLCSKLWSARHFTFRFYLKSKVVNYVGTSILVNNREIKSYLLLYIICFKAHFKWPISFLQRNKILTELESYHFKCTNLYCSHQHRIQDSHYFQNQMNKFTLFLSLQNTRFTLCSKSNVQVYIVIINT